MRDYVSECINGEVPGELENYRTSKPLRHTNGDAFSGELIV